MRLSQYFLPTLREDPSEAEVVSHKFMLRAGMIRKVAAGIYNYLPAGLKVIKKVENIVRKYMNEAGAIELLMPAVVPAELWIESGRWNVYGKELLRLKDRHDRDFCIGPTHEEVVTDIVRNEVKSYKQLPLNLYQIQTKFRDEVRPRFGLMRGREFIMKDAYSFDVDDEGAEKSYMLMYEAYCKIFEACGLEYVVVEADSGAIGGNFSHEFMVTADTGEDFVISCTNCDFAANIEKAPILDEGVVSDEPLKEPEIVTTKNIKKVVDVADYLGIPPHKHVKTLILKSEDKFFAILIRGDRELNLAKVKNFFDLPYVEFADEEDILRITGGPVGFSGPKGLDIPVYADYEIKYMKNFVLGVNEKDKHQINSNLGRDFEVDGFGDFRNAVPGDKCARCKKGEYKITKGIEVGHIFKLGTKYSKAMNAYYLDKDGKQKLMVMGCYGIGIGRTAAAAIEQNHDEKGIIWPVQIAPFEVVIVPINTNSEDVVNLSETLYLKLKNNNVDVLIDDRDERAGVKFNDADLVGYPLRINVGAKALAKGNVEIFIRKTKETVEVKKEDAIAKTMQLLDDLRSKRI
ncbi:prolyl-tRNA synthetase [Deferribacter desulfuricans SSM1]|uniref:Proline--tRNA ligase n=1 Tax=Deferribacter desulfuricans (strain DSM 14783 / JCM 11476 / NBRC 101012 / SSM1) TaxID=639282 RepID=D3P9X8_DEFDS|nr:proline--tRNA ligase [Deferribacter desulfuricans]BAI81518.1 prolyl-tRNA synthetase [Deferribacter desulfuricans SSM1]